ncbi:YeiH family protein [Dongshaea marina]|uniref:YeiH family protein n=1 Tax=Dongshaea marina TaxID=2047966 RepID=UPI000D3EAA5E|nr:putative sulfate exporter family transporter [Dongshaea marina]
MILIASFEGMKRGFSGVLLCVALAGCGIVLNRWIPIGAVTITIILGFVVGNLIPLPKTLDTGIRFSEKQLLGLAIMLLGSKLNFVMLSQLGLKAILVILLGLAFTICIGFFVGRLLKLDGKLALLLGIGNGICGSSAIAAASPVVQGKAEQMVLAVTVVNFLGTLGIFILPLIAHLTLGSAPLEQGILIGNTLQAVGQVSAAGFAMGDQIGQGAMIIKMGRILMLGPILLLLALLLSRAQNRESVAGKRQFPIPPFIIGFALLAVVASLHILPAGLVSGIGDISELILTVAMAGMGLKIRFDSIIRYGAGALGAGALIWALQILFTLLLLLSLY